MSAELYVAFLLACILLSITPGPNMSVFMSNGAAYGVRGALTTVAGTAIGNALLVLLAVIGVMAAVTIFADWFDWLRWIGAVYLFWLGFTRIRALLSPANAVTVPPARGRWFLQGLAVSVSNPKVLLFLGALFPQFIDASSLMPVNAQLAILAATFIIITTAIDGLLAMSIALAKSWFDPAKQRAAEGFSGVCLIVGGLWLAMNGRTQ